MFLPQNKIFTNSINCRKARSNVKLTALPGKLGNASAL